jgi:hypothetical protein
MGKHEGKKPEELTVARNAEVSGHKIHSVNLVNLVIP